MSRKHLVLIADPLHEDGRRILAAGADLKVEVATGLDEGTLQGRIADFDALIVRSKTRVTAAVIAAGRRLKVIGRAGIGVDNIDVPAATERGVVVFNTPDSNATTTAELALAHMFSLSRHLPQADRSVRAGEWEPSRFLGAELTGKTAGVVGFGAIGRIFAQRCLALQMKVLAFDPFVTPEAMRDARAEPADLDELLAMSDYVSLHCPLMEATRNLIDARRLAAMKPGARLINCARGGLIDEAALHDALKSGRLAGAALDVFAAEPPQGSPLLALDNVVLTPHLGASTAEAQQAVSVKIAETVLAFLKTGATSNAVNLPRLSGEQLVRARPYQVLARALGSLASDLAPGPITEIGVGLFGRAAEIDSRPVAAECLVGLLSKRLAVPVNQVNALSLAHRQGMKVVETRSEETDEYVSLVRLAVRTAAGETAVAGTLLGERQPRLVRIDGFDVEAVPEGHMLFTRHDDRPGVVGALGGILGREGINISRMHVGGDAGQAGAIALIAVSARLPESAMIQIRELPAIRQAIQIEL